jgi:small-conductance mechanosensitive channel
MENWIKLVPPNQAVQILDVKLVGVNAENGKKLLFTLAFIVAVWLLARLARLIVYRLLAGSGRERVRFWARQAIQLSAAVVLLLGIASIWFDDPTRLATALGLISAGLAFALQKVVSAVAGYVVILRGNTFNVGDRIVMGGVRGDVVALGFIHTTIMEMGQPPPVQTDQPAMWVKSRQYTGRMVAVSNSQVFDEPVYNYTREFPYIWEEIALPVPYRADWEKAEQILLSAAERHSTPMAELGETELAELERRYFMKRSSIRPRVYSRLTDNWLELTVRFLVTDHGIRNVKDAMARDILRGLNQAGIEVASATFGLVEAPRMQVEVSGAEHGGRSHNSAPVKH